MISNRVIGHRKELDWSILKVVYKPEERYLYFCRCFKQSGA